MELWSATTRETPEQSIRAHTNSVKNSLKHESWNCLENDETCYNETVNKHIKREDKWWTPWRLKSFELNKWSLIFAYKNGMALRTTRCISRPTCSTVYTGSRLRARKAARGPTTPIEHQTRKLLRWLFIKVNVPIGRPRSDVSPRSEAELGPCGPDGRKSSEWMEAATLAPSTRRWCKKRAFNSAVDFYLLMRINVTPRGSAVTRSLVQQLTPNL